MAKQWQTIGAPEEEEKKWGTIGVIDPTGPTDPDAPVEPPYSLDQMGTDTKHILKAGGQAAADFLDTPHAIRSLYEDYVPEVVKSGGDLMVNTMFPLARGIEESAPDVLTGRSPVTELPGLKQAKEIFASPEEGATETADSIRKGGEWSIGGLRKLVMKSADIVPDLLMGGGAFLGDLLAPKDSSVGELGGGTTGLIVSILRGKGIKATADAVEAVKEVAEGQNITDIARAAPDEAGTLADVTGDKGLYDLQATLDATPEGKTALTAKELERQQQIASEVRAPFGQVGADTAPAQDAATKYIDEVIEKVSARTGKKSDALEVPYRPLQKALDESDAAVQRTAADAAESDRIATELLMDSKLPLATNQTLAQSGGKMHEVATAERKVDDDAANVLWDKFREQGNVELDPLREGVSELFKGLTQRQRDKFNKKYGKLFGWLKGKGKEGSSADIHGDIRDMKAELRAAYRSDGGLTDADKNLEALIKSLDSSLEASNSAYGAARDATREIHVRWDDGAIPDALQGPPELFGKTLPLGDEIGAYNARILNAAEIPGMPEAIVERLKSLSRRSKTGIDEGFMAEYESVMDSMPQEFRQQANAFIEAGEASEAATALAESTQKVSELTTKANQAERTVLDKALEAEQQVVAEGGKALEKTVAKANLAKYSKDPSKTVRSLIKSGDGKGLAALNRQIESLGPEAQDAFRALIGDELIAKLSKGGDAAGVRAIDDLAAPLTPKAFKEFSDLRDTLVEGNLIDSATADKIAEALRKTKSSAMRADGTSRLFNTTSKGGDLASSGLAVAAAKLMPGGGTASLVMTGALKRFFKERLSGVKQNSQVHRLLNDMILDPQKFVKGVEKAENSEDAVRMIIAKLNAAIQTTAATQED